jgi:hypothetical protein
MHVNLRTSDATVTKSATGEKSEASGKDTNGRSTKSQVLL